MLYDSVSFMADSRYSKCLGYSWSLFLTFAVSFQYNLVHQTSKENNNFFLHLCNQGLVNEELHGCQGESAGTNQHLHKRSHLLITERVSLFHSQCMSFSINIFYCLQLIVYLSWGSKFPPIHSLIINVIFNKPISSVHVHRDTVEQKAPSGELY